MSPAQKIQQKVRYGKMMKWIVWRDSSVSKYSGRKTDSTRIPKIVEAPTAAEAVKQEAGEFASSQRWFAVALNNAYVVSIKPRREYDVFVQNASYVFTDSSGERDDETFDEEDEDDQ